MFLPVLPPSIYSSVLRCLAHSSISNHTVNGSLVPLTFSSFFCASAHGLALQVKKYFAFFDVINASVIIGASGEIPCFDKRVCLRARA